VRLLPTPVCTRMVNARDAGAFYHMWLCMGVWVLWLHMDKYLDMDIDIRTWHGTRAAYYRTPWI
jgi:hypothetical protein